MILDKRLHKQLNSVLFVSIKNDGFNLGAQRRAVVNSDLPEATRLLKGWMTAPDKFEGDGVIAQEIERTRLVESGDFNLSGERYGIAIQDASKHTLVLLGDEGIFKIESGGTPSSTEESYWNGDFAWATLADLPAGDHITHVTTTVRTITEQGLKNSSAKMLPVNTILVSSRATIGRIALAKIPLATNQGFKNIIIQDTQKASPQFVAYMMKRLTPEMERMASGGTFKEISKSAIATLSIPLPPLEVQNQIIAEIEGYQKIIDGARQVLDNYKPHIVVQPDWPIEKVGAICENLDSKREPVTKGDRSKGIYPYYGASGIVDYVEGYIFDEPLLLISEDGANLLARSTPIAFSVTGKIWVNNHAHVVRFADLATQRYVEVFINSIDVSGYVTGSAQPKLNQAALSSMKIPLPELPTQRAIVAEIEAEQALVNANRELIRRMEAKVKDAIDRVWGNGS